MLHFCSQELLESGKGGQPARRDMKPYCARPSINTKGWRVCCAAFCPQELLESGKTEANQRAETYKQLWNFPNTYTLGKHMGEQLVTRYQAQLQLPVAIVRPSLTSAIAGEPYPGTRCIEDMLGVFGVWHEDREWMAQHAFEVAS